MRDEQAPEPELPAHDEAVIEWKPVKDLLPTTVTFEGARVGRFDIGQFFCEVLEVRLGGEYRPGSQGAPDAAAIVEHVGALLLRTEPDVVLLELSALRYVWGDGLLRVFEVIGRFDRDYPLGVVVLGGPACTPALRSLGAVVHTDPLAALEEAKAKALRRAFDIG